MAIVLTCPLWEQFKQDLTEHIVWHRECLQCQRTVVVSGPVMRQMQKGEAIQLVCEECAAGRNSS